MSGQALPLIYRAYKPLHHVLTQLGHISILGRHPATIFRNKLSRLLYKTVLRSEKTTIIRSKIGFQLCVPLYDQAAATILFEREYSPQEAAVMLKLLALSDGLIDIGANLGYFSFLAWHYFSQQARDFRILAIEPNPDLCILLQESMRVNDVAEENFELIHAALGEEDGEISLVWERCLSSNAHIAQQVPRSAAYRQATVPIKSLDPFLQSEQQRKWLIKIDVEGAESLVLRGSLQAFVQRAIFLCEVTSDRHVIADILSAHDYCAITHQGTSINLRSSRSVTRDLLLVPNEQIDEIKSITNN